MASVKIEYAHIGIGPLYHGSGQGMLRDIIGSLPLLTVTGTATAAGSRPVVPAGNPGEQIYAILFGTAGSRYVVAWGADPTATDSPASVAAGAKMKSFVDMQEMLIPVTAGDKLSFIAA